VVVAASVLMLILAYGIEHAHKRMGIMHVEVLESLGAIIVVSIGLAGMIFGLYFLQSQNVFPTGSLGQMFSAGNLGLLYLGVGIKVTAGILLIAYAMLMTSQGEKG
jgi:multicomponent Na+:H+ antiporter subunit B